MNTAPAAPLRAAQVPSVCSGLQSTIPCCLWITGLPSAGKSTLARALSAELQERNQPVFVLDGDELRRGLCSDLGLSDADRQENIRRAGEVARLMFDAGLNVICAFVSPFAADRDQARRLFPEGCFAEIHLATPLATCMARDPKGLYAKAQAGQLTGLTGWDAPYEIPTAPEFSFDTLDISAAETARQVLHQLRIGCP